MCSKIIRLDLEHVRVSLSQKKLQGKDTTNQLIRALALHTKSQIEQILSQIDTFRPDQKQRATEAIYAVYGYYNAVKSNERSGILLTDLSDADLQDELILVFTAGRRTGWDDFLRGFFGYKLVDLKDTEKVRDVQKRIAKLPLTKNFTNVMRQLFVDYCNNYL